jgi:NAD+ dependent glucose-6-phosphate dehydrogenase
MERIAITGAAGLIGRLLAAELGSDHDVRAIDRVWRTGSLRRRQDTRRVELAERLFDGATTVIDLAADARLDAPWQSVLRGNLPATIGAFDAARRAGARRVIFASSHHVTGLYERDEPYASICAGRYEGLDPAAIPKIGAADPVRPDSPYGVVKAAGEAAARYYAEEHGLSAICIRIGTVYQDDRPHSSRGFAKLLTHADLFSLVRACIAAPPEVGFGIVYGVSANKWRFWDLEEARRLVGWEPVDDAERFRD